MRFRPKHCVFVIDCPHLRPSCIANHVGNKHLRDLPTPDWASPLATCHACQSGVGKSRKCPCSPKRRFLKDEPSSTNLSECVYRGSTCQGLGNYIWATRMSLGRRAILAMMCMSNSHDDTIIVSFELILMNDDSM